MSQWSVTRNGRGFIVQHGPIGRRVASFPTIDRWYWWLASPYLVAVGMKTVKNWEGKSNERARV